MFYVFLLSKTTIATPLSAVKTILSLSLFNSDSAFLSSLLRLGLGAYACLSIPFISALNSSTSLLVSFWQAVSIAVMESRWGGWALWHNLGFLTVRTWTSVRGVLDKFITHLLLLFEVCN